MSFSGFRFSPAQIAHRVRRAIYSKAFIRRMLFVIGGGGFFIAASWTTLFFTRAFALAYEVASIERALDVYDIPRAQLSVADARARTHELVRMLRMVGFLRHAPFLGESYIALLRTGEGAESLLDISYDGLALIEHFVDALDRAEPDRVLSFLEDPRAYADLSSHERRALMNAFAQSAGALRTLRIALELATQDVEKIEASHLRFEPLVQGIERVQHLLPRIVTALEVMTPFASIARDFSGLDEEVQFLILYLNNAELRPGGGFIGAYSLMQVREGEIVDFSTEDSYFADRLVEGNAEYFIAPPDPIKNYLGIPEWYFRDASWSPSFAQTARDARQLLRQELAFGKNSVPTAQHIVGITPDFIEALLRLVGPVSANGTTYTADNVYELLQYQVEQGFVASGIVYEDRKLALKVLSETMLSRLLEMSPESWLTFFATFSDELEKKHVAFASTHEDTQAFLEEAGWAGVFSSAAADDVVLLVDGNLGALKTDPVIDRHMTYHMVQTPDGGYRARVTITYTHQGIADYKTGQYRTYTQLFAPLGSTLVSVEGADREVFVGEDFGMTRFGTFFVVELGGQKTLTFTYDLPTSVAHAIARGMYTLAVFKQMGAGDNLLTLDLDFGTNLISADPGEDRAAYGDTRYQFTAPLERDLYFYVGL